MVTVDEVKKAYVKMKSDIYYSNNIKYKYMIADFESKENFEKTFDEVAKIYNGDLKLFDLYLDKISIFSLPKKVEKKASKNIIYGLTDENYVDSVNFFIDAPIEIFLLDVLWTLDVGKECYNKKILDDDSIYGNVLSSFKLFESEIDNSTFFEPYFYKYTSWRNNAFSAIRRLNPNDDLILINYDIKQYYYNYYVNFDEIKDYLQLDNDVNCLVIEKIYSKYNNLLKKYKKLKKNTKRYVLPIGLYSSKIISNIALSKYDKYVRGQVEGKGYYGRYVDDMIIVYPLSDATIKNKKELNIEKIIENTFGFLTFKDNECFIPFKHLQLKDNNFVNKLEINPKKIDMYYFKKADKDILSKIYKNKILMRVSDVGYYVEDAITEKTLVNELFRYQSSEYLNKISDLKTTSIDKYSLSIMLTKLFNLYKNVSKEDIEKEGSKIAEMLIDVLSNDEGIKYHQFWEKIFNLLNIFGRKYVKRYYDNMFKYISNNIKFVFENGDYKNEEKVKKMTNYNLILILKHLKNMTLSAKKIDKNINSDKWLKSLMINRNITTKPLYLLRKNKISDYVYELDEKKKEYLPYWVSIEELSAYFSMQEIFNNCSNINYDQIIDEYCKINKIEKDMFVTPHNIGAVYYDERAIRKHEFEYTANNGKQIVKLLNQLVAPKRGINETDEDYKERLENYTKKLIDYGDYNIGIASIPLKENILKEKLKKKETYCDVKYKRLINHILNEAIKNKIDHLVLPELSIPFSWMLDIMFFARRHNIQVTFGLQFIVNKSVGSKEQRVANCVASLYPFKVCSVYKLMFCDMREKKYYTYEEIEMFNENKLLFNDAEKRSPKIVSFRNGFFTNLLCYELTSLKERCDLLDSITNLFVPVFNRDTNYFSSIVDATARELYCYVSLANTSEYGDSKITGPFPTIYKDIVRLKGGKNGYLAVGKVDIKSLHNNRAEGNKKHEDKKYKPLSAGAHIGIVVKRETDDFDKEYFSLECDD
ncbi:MAG: hypothetical protein IJX78_08160 [Bacilli bacterium]|nr:hypothetical protein [Bacilli bacterium]